MDWLVDAWEWIRERFEDMHEIMCGVPQVGPLFDEYPIVAYFIVAASIGIFIWFKISLKKG